MDNNEYIFDANQHEPDAGFELVPAGIYDLEVTGTDVKDDGKSGWFFLITFDITSGDHKGKKLANRYGLGNVENAENARISHAQISALCHVTGRFRVTKSSKGRELIGAKLRGRFTNDGTYNNLKAVFDTAGNPPRKGGAVPATAPAAGAPAAAANWGQNTAVAHAAPSAPTAPAAPVAEAAFPPADWIAHPTPGYFYKGQEVLTEAQLRERVAASAAPSVPPAAPGVPAVAPWGNKAA